MIKTIPLAMAIISILIITFTIRPKMSITIKKQCQNINSTYINDKPIYVFMYTYTYLLKRNVHVLVYLIYVYNLTLIHIFNMDSHYSSWLRNNEILKIKGKFWNKQTFYWLVFAGRKRDYSIISRARELHPAFANKDQWWIRECCVT